MGFDIKSALSTMGRSLVRVLVAVATLAGIAALVLGALWSEHRRRLREARP